ncbi:hypothetical protein I350_03491 [Cryptococcus amylolentus CBS 6273]|uniref:Uncharacterized protein n=1 Tax=Cryptococcus amylolentus CBS 6273 TaxID=1296118 RepID=A0A1E3K451_9TREE|nr:hypothetical protein I350_03491 [Cryptococcus amylolentus CBS 6273]
MPPRRNLKRHNEDDARRPNKRAGKNKRNPTYDTYDEALDGGVEQEEKGERYRDGEKSQRFYERAIELYTKAAELQETYDAVYNKARALYTLATDFFLPPSSLPLFRESITLYQKANDLTNSPLLRMDVAFNLSQTFTTLADVLEDLQTDDDTDKDEVVRKLRCDARDTLAEVMDGQEAFLRTVAMQEGGETDEASEEATEALEDSAEGEGMEVDAGSKEGEEGENSATFETHLPTPSTFIDTVVTLMDIHLTLWESVPTPQPPTEDEQIAVRVILDRAAAIAPEEKQPELLLLEIKVLLAMDRLIWDAYKGEAKAGSGVERSLDGAVVALGKVLESLTGAAGEDSHLRAEIITTLADTHMTIANRLAFLSTQLPPGPSSLAQDAWLHLTEATNHLTTAADLPTDGNTPRTFKPSIFLSLSKASLARAKLSEVNDAAKRNVVQLFDNAATYAGRAGETLGWKFVRIGPAPASTGGVLSIGGSSIGGSDLPYQAGWESELLGRSIALQQLRVCFYATQTGLIPSESLVKYQEGSTKLLVKLKALPEGERKIGRKDVERWVGEIENEGEMGEVEKTWWNELKSELQS